MILDSEQSKKIQLALCEVLDLNPEKVTDISVEVTGDTAYLAWKGSMQLPAQTVVDIINGTTR